MKRVLAADVVRGFAAGYVFAAHLLLMNLSGHHVWLLAFHFGQEVVMLFFLLSGFLIMRSMECAKDKSFGQYFANRALRIYPIFILALAFTYTLNGPHHGVHSLIGNLVMLQDYPGSKEGIAFAPYGGNIPLWSLSYEWWFYLLFFPIYTFLSERWQLYVVTTVSVSALAAYLGTHFQPFIFIAYFSIWWAGAELGRASLREAPLPIRRMILAISPLLLIFSVWTSLTLLHHELLELAHTRCLAYATPQRRSCLSWRFYFAS